MFYLLFSPGDNHLQVILLKITEGYFLPVSWVSCYLIGPINSRPCEGCWNLKICSSTRPIKEYVLISTGLPYRSLKMSCEKWERLRELSKEMIYASFFHFICNVGYFMGICYQYFNDRHTIWGWLVDVQLKVNVYFEGRNGIYVCYSYLKTIWCQILKIWSWLYWSPILKTIITTNLTVNGSSASSTFLWLYYLYIMSTLFQKLSSSLFFFKEDMSSGINNLYFEEILFYVSSSATWNPKFCQLYLFCPWRSWRIFGQLSFWINKCSRLLIPTPSPHKLFFSSLWDIFIVFFWDLFKLSTFMDVSIYNLVPKH